MPEIEKKATRQSYGEALAALSDKYEKLVVLDADLAAATKTGLFKKVCPDRFIDCGIAEGNMMGIAAGLAASGMIPFASTFAMFAAGRAYEQIRNSIGYPHLPVKIGATHAGISVGEDGATHQCNEDLALMRSIPGMTVISPSDDIEAKAAVQAAILHDGPVYLRFGRLATPIFNHAEDYQFTLGKGIVLKEIADITFIATGLMVYEALQAAVLLEEEGIRAGVINIHTIKPLDEDLILQAAAKSKLLVTLEEHSVIGGLGSAICETVSEKMPVPVFRIGIPDCFGMSGSAEELLEHFGLTAPQVFQAVKKRITRK